MANGSEVIVIGAGPGGCAAGIFLARAGLKVTIVEGGKHPRHRVGESLLPASMPILGRLGVTGEELSSRFQPKFGARFYDPVADELATFGFESATNKHAPSYQVIREEFDAMLDGRARAAGCEVVDEMFVEGMEEDLDRPVVRLRDGRTLACDFLVDASGRGAMLARKRKTQRMITDYGRVGIYNYFAELPPHDSEDAKYITMYLFSGGWVWLIPLADGRTSVGVVLAGKQEARRREQEGVGAKGYFWEAVARMPRLEGRLKAGRATEEYRAIADYSYSVREKFGERFVLIGDAAGFLDPIFSSGVHLALSSAERAALGIVRKLETGSDAGLREYAAYMDQGYRVFTAFVDRFYNRHLAENLFFMRNKPAEIHAAICRILAGHVWEEDNPVLKLIGAGPREIKVTSD